MLTLLINIGLAVILFVAFSVFLGVLINIYITFRDLWNEH